MIKIKIYRIVEKGSHGRKMNRLFDYFIMVLILLSVVAIILESIPDIYAEYNKILRVFNLFSIIVFSIEYLFRLYFLI